MSFALEDVLLPVDAEGERIRKCFQEHGIYIVRSLLDADHIACWQDTLIRLIAARINSLGHEAPPGGLDDHLRELMRHVEDGGLDIIRIAKDLPLFYSSMANGDIQRFAKASLGADFLQAVHDIALFRIDPPEYTVRNFGWHQDYHYNVGSEESLVVWYPLTPVTGEKGRLRFVPRSHGDILPVVFDDRHHEPGKGTAHNVFTLDADDQELERRSVELPDMEPGDVAFFDGRLIHRSGSNVGDGARWVVNFRLGNALDPKLINRGWRTMRDRTPDMFERIHPDLVRRTAGPQAGPGIAR